MTADETPDTDIALEQQKRFMDAFGGDAALASKLALRRQTVHQWRHRGIAWRWRARLVRMATMEGIPVPPDFFELKHPRRQRSADALARYKARRAAKARADAKPALKTDDAP